MDLALDAPATAVRTVLNNNLHCVELVTYFVSQSPVFLGPSLFATGNQIIDQIRIHIIRTTSQEGFWLTLQNAEHTTESYQQTSQFASLVRILLFGLVDITCQFKQNTHGFCSVEVVIHRLAEGFF